MWRRSSLRFLGCILVAVFLAVESWAAGKPNIVLITLDGLRADRAEFLGAKAKLTPSFDNLGNDGVIFLRAYAQAPETVSSTATILTGTYPQTHRASEFGIPLATTLPYLPDQLHQAGYRTAAFVGTMQLDPREGPFQGYSRGFETFEASFHLPRRGESRYQADERHADQVVTRAIEWIASVKSQTFFLWVNLHDPASTSGVGYDRAVTACDASVGKLVGFLRSQSVYNNTAIVVSSSHGESFGAHGESRAGAFLYDESTHVPLLLKLPQQLLAGKQIVNQVRLLDVAPTLLETAHIPVPSQMQGQSLIRIAQSGGPASQPAYARADLPDRDFGFSVVESWRAGKYLYIRAPTPELYDLSTDPNAKHNLASGSKATMETAASQLQSLDDRLANQTARTAALSPTEVQKLASLGYVGLQRGNPGSVAVQGADPKDGIAMINETLDALIAIEDGTPEKALPVLQRALAVQPKTYLAQYGMGIALAEEKKDADAIVHFHEAIELRPDSPWAHLAMGSSLMRTGDYKTAVVHLEIASGRLPESAAAHSLLADAYEHLGRKGEAAKERAQAASAGKN
jgi:choline-sulfatase